MLLCLLSVLSLLSFVFLCSELSTVSFFIVKLKRVSFGIWTMRIMKVNTLRVWKRKLSELPKSPLEGSTLSLRFLTDFGVAKEWM